MSAPASAPVDASSVDERDARSSVADIEPPPPARAPAESRPADSEVGRRPTAPPPPAAEAAGRVEELKSKAQKQEQAKRYNEYVKTLIEIAEAVSDPAEKIDNYAKAADLYSGKFSNAAEAVKCYEAILAIDGEHAQAIDFLRQSYEKRRDWEKLIGLLRREAAALPEGGDRAAKYLEIAKLASERVKKVDFCIELWDEVLANDPENPEALNALAGLYERHKDYQAFARCCRSRSTRPSTAPRSSRSSASSRSSTASASRTTRRPSRPGKQVIALNPQDRKAQEALKKAYLQLQRWDDLEVFYAESGKWDEFIRVLESQEAKETDDAAKISLLVKIAELWMVQKQKADRAARAYEKVLSIDGSHLAAAEALIPIYTQANNPKGLAGAIEVKLSHDQDDVSRLDLYRQVAALYETRLKEPQRAFERYLSAFQIAPQDEQCIDDVERAARVDRRWDALIQAYSSAISRAESEGDIALGVDLRLRLGRVLLDEVKRIDEALVAVPRRVRGGWREPGRDRRAGAALPRDGPVRRAARHLREEARHRHRAGGAQADPLRDRRALRRASSATRRRRSRRTARCSTTSRRTRRRSRRSTSSTASSRTGSPTSTCSASGSTLRSTSRRSSTSSSGSGAPSRSTSNDAAGALENYQEILILDPGNDAARLALEALLENESLRAEAAADPAGDLRGARRLGEADPGARDPRARPRATRRRAWRCSGRWRARRPRA